LAELRQWVADTDLTLSARMLAEMRTQGQGFFDYTHAVSERHKHYYAGLPEQADKTAMFRNMAAESFRRQREIEAADKVSFDQFLADYMRSD
jgi:glutamate--cysteine ligase